AAQRISEVTGLNAQTIHRVLEYTPYEKNGFSFNKNETNPIDADVVIVDEVSMVDLYLMSRLLAALQQETQLILVGDSNQLPSVGPGNVLADIVASGIMPHINLTTIFRQAKSSRIILAAHEINQGITPYFSNSKEDNCFFIEEREPEIALNTIIELVSRRLPSSYNFNPITDIQVLSPMHKGVLGTENINSRLQVLLNRSTKSIKSGNSVFYVGDKVMQIKNNYEKNVFNGDIGIIVDIIEDSGIIVNFEGNVVIYDPSTLDELTLAYCISIHKSQGSEFNCVIIPLVTQHYIMLQRNLIYTALTRAKKLCVFVGSRKALHIAVQSDKAITRHSRLKERLLSFLSNQKDII
ncbi:MAG: ATP-dependent RecD-like DNA helicase, partial [Chitinispirillaceae bacterium]|nr:ATP-dependent RecD-like DNA helicase [Chitinispirillaceae bacterium]